jgi:uncharacterized protein (DUF2236 family)
MPDAPSYFTDDSMLRRVHREWAVALSAPRALLMQATHPVAWAGFFTHTGALDEPYVRLERTAQVMDTIMFGSRANADRMTRRVRAMHRRVAGEMRSSSGRFPAGHARTGPTTPSCCCGSSPASSTARCSSTSATSAR